MRRPSKSGAISLGDTERQTFQLSALSDARHRAPPQPLDDADAKTLLKWIMLSTFVIYADRGAAAVMLPTFKKYYHINDTLGGLLGSLFIAGYMLASPMFGYVAKTRNSLKIMQYSVLFFVLASILGGFSYFYIMMAIARILTGVAEAGLITLSSPVINDVAPTSKKTLWLSFLSMILVIGISGGMVFTQIIVLITGSPWVMFYIFAAFAAIMVCMPYFDRQLGKVFRNPFFDHTKTKEADIRPFEEMQMTNISGNNISGGANSGFYQTCDDVRATSFWDDVCSLIKNPTLILLILGGSAITFSFGGFVYWGVDYCAKQYDLSDTMAALSCGVMSIVCGFVGPLLGGYHQDKLLAKHHEITLRRRGEIGVKLAAVYIFAGFAVGLPSIFSPNAVLFFAGVTLSFTLIFATFPLTTSATLACVPHELQHMTMALQIAVFHIFGDMLSPTMIGYINDSTHNPQLGFVILFLWLLWAVIAFMTAYVMFMHPSKSCIKSFRRMFRAMRKRRQKTSTNSTIHENLITEVAAV